MAIVDHWLAQARRVASPNCDARPDAADIALVVIHCISLPKGVYGGGQVEALFCNRLDCSPPAFADLAGQRVSSHLFVRRDGELVQFVPFDRRAWHAGESSHQGRSQCNDFSIGIELEGTDTAAFEDAQYQALNAVLAELAGTYPIKALAGHSDIAPGRKTDPGPGFDWRRVKGAPRG